jgi:hypothetical protein
MHGLNDLSTYGTHPKDFNPEQVKPVLNNLLIIVKWYFGYKDPVTFSKLKAEKKNSDLDKQVSSQKSTVD